MKAEAGSAAPVTPPADGAVRPANEEQRRLREITNDASGWRHWGPYVSDRAWGTVREDYSANGAAWDFLSHDQARSKAFRWGEDALAGLTDRYQLLVFAPAFWNGKDPILKERLFGLTSSEGNHGEDVKEYYYYLDNTPTHSYMKYLYKYPQAEFPYANLAEENRRRGGEGFEYELLDTGAFDDDRYFDIVVEYAKAGTEDICVRIEAFNRGPAAAPLHILPHLWFRNTWSLGPTTARALSIQLGPEKAGFVRLIADDTDADRVSGITHYRLGRRTLFAASGGKALFTNNETNRERLYGCQARNDTPYVKDAFHRHVVHGEPCVNPNQTGTRAALHYQFDVPAGGSVVVRLRLTDRDDLKQPIEEVDTIVATRRREADEFYEDIYPANATADERLVQRQAFAGLLWTKQSYLFDVRQWLDGDGKEPAPPASRRNIRNQHWHHLNSLRVMTVPDKWEYPWFAAWDLAFHCVAFAIIDPRYAKDQLWVLLFEQFQHPNGQIPAYEWEFSDLNPPVHAWAVWRVYNMDRRRSGVADRDFLEKCFHKLLINFAWWVNKVDSSGNNLFEGGFLGLDNITVVDRSEKFQDGAVLEQSDATGWMGMFCLNLMRIALELAKENHVYESLAVKFFEHYVLVAHAMKHMGGRNYQLWDDQDHFFYDVLRYPDGRFHKFRVRSLVGLIPLFAVERLELAWVESLPEFRQSFEWFLRNRPELIKDVIHEVKLADGTISYVLTIVNDDQLRALVERVWDPSEFLSDYGIRSMSKVHLEHPFEMEGRVVRYEPAEASVKLKGGNSNWRGPIWMPTTFLLIESLRKLGQAYGSDYRVSPPPDKKEIALPDMARELAGRLVKIFTRDETTGRRPVFGGAGRFQSDPHWRDHILFYEYFHGDDGAGLGASHQTGWTALVAALIDEWRR